jgi:hypothetical protein
MPQFGDSLPVRDHERYFQNTGKGEEIFPEPGEEGSRVKKK